MTDVSTSAAPAAGAGRTRIGDYLIDRLRDLGVEHVFGVPGDFVLRLMKRMEEVDLPLINTCDEQGAGFAADAYARLRGIGVVCITYGVGGLKIANTTGQAYAEESPVVVISGAPGLAERAQHPLLHHKVRAYETQRLVFDQLTVASAVLDDPATACREIDRVLGEVVRQKRPVYLELPRDLVDVEGPLPDSDPVRPLTSNPAPLAAALADATEWIARAERPVVVLGVETQRFGLVEQALDFIERVQLPVAVTLLGKSAVPENHPCFVGVYAGHMGRADVAEYVESSDCAILLGSLLTDINLGLFTAHLDPGRTIHATRDRITVGYRSYEGVRFSDFVAGLAAADLAPRPPAADLPLPNPFKDGWTARPGERITVARLFERLATFLREDTIVIADPGDALFAATDLPVRRSGEFLSPAYYASLGFAVPAAIGAQLANPAMRPLVLVGDGAFQMTGMELSTVARYGLNPIVIVLNNGGYTTERLILDGGFNDIQPWAYHRLPDVLGAGRGFLVETEEDLDRALITADGDRSTFALLDVRLDRLDFSPALRRLGAELNRAVTQRS